MKRIFINNEFVECNNYYKILTKDIIEADYLINKMSSREMSCKYKINKTIVLSLLKKYDIEARKGKIDLINQKFGFLTVIERLETSKNNQVNWLCLCECGQNVKRHTHTLKHNNHISCGCKDKKPLRNPNKQNGKYLPYQVWNVIEKGAIARKLEISITFEYIESLLEQQEFKCSLTKIQLILPTQYIDLDAGFKNLSLDRIDSSKGYVEGNVRWVHKWVNRMKLDYSDNEFIYLCTKIAENNTIILSNNEISYIENTFDINDKQQSIANFKQKIANNQRRRIKEKKLLAENNLI